MSEQEPQPGIYRGMSFPDYLNIDAINASMLKPHAVSPRHAKWKAGEDQDTAALSLGRVVHTAMLEPDRFASEYAVAPKVDRRTKAGKQRWAEFQAESEGRIVVTAEEHRLACVISTQAYRVPHIADLLAVDEGEREVTVVQTEPEHGLLCKARPDIVRRWDNRLAIVDVKTTSAQNLLPHTLSRDIHRFGYHIQAAWYMDLWAMATGESPDAFVLLFCQTNNDMDVAAYELDEDSIEQGRREARRYLKRIVECRASGSWPGVQPSRVGTIGLPVYALESTIDPLVLNIGGQEVSA